MKDQKSYSTMTRLAKDLRNEVCTVCGSRLDDKFVAIIDACSEADEIIRIQYDDIQTLVRQRDSLLQNYNVAVEQLGYDLFDIEERVDGDGG